MSQLKLLPRWTLIVPVASWGAFGLHLAVPSAWAAFVLGVGLFACVIAAVHHAEVIAHRLGEPLGTLVLAIAITIIEVGMIVSVVSADPASAASLGRDTVFSAIMIILNGVIGTCLLIGGLRHHEQSYVQAGVSTALATLACLSVMVLILPNYVISVPGPIYSPPQLVFAAMFCFALYATFILIQTVRHRDYFLDGPAPDVLTSPKQPFNNVAKFAACWLIVCLVGVVVFSKSLAPIVEGAVRAFGAPAMLVGVTIAIVVILPEGLAALRAARHDRLQTSLNLALGSALASIGLTIPVLVALALAFNWPLVLGINPTNTVLLVLTLLVSTLTLGTGRTTVMQGALHLSLFAAFLFLVVVP